MRVKWLCNGYTRRRVTLWIALLTIIAAVTASCAPTEPPLPEEGEMTLFLSSPRFEEGEDIPIEYTCDGQDISPPLSWGGPPSETQSFALIMDDPDPPGGVFTHWLLFNLPPDSRELPEAVAPDNEPPNGALQGQNSFGAIGYCGPCPPPGPAHHYRFTLYALDQRLDLVVGVSRRQVLDAITGHVLAWG
jgi:Raf kinase inhibitor-like YbhB/YbcL family protein